MTDRITKGDPVAESAPRGGRPAWLQMGIAIPAAVLPLLPSFSCPVCVAAYAGVLTSLGLGFLLVDQVQRPLIVVFLIVSVTSVGWATGRHKKLGPFALVLLGSVAVVAGRLLWTVQPALYVGVSCLVAGAVWNLILKRPWQEFVSLGAPQDGTADV